MLWAVRLFLFVIDGRHYYAAPKPSIQAPQYTWKGRQPSATASQTGKTKIDGAASSALVWRRITSVAGVKMYLTPFRGRAVRGRILLDRSGGIL